VREGILDGNKVRPNWEDLDERNWYLFRSVYCAVRDPAARQDAQAETTGRLVRITVEDVPVLRIGHISANSALLGVLLPRGAVKSIQNSRSIPELVSVRLSV
jgi:hypothetical protein